ncbi:MAG: SinI family restriction endonuclease [Corynebacterium sp.]|uniref:SinI family restriction endonuclease n=1 Tax=Corynebacterium sp. TaxID=1720 RepID=UPI0026DACD57|nr:SinI family restriction endonuclease [Corynebacterium sp.]MDO4762686.1 SinI family restriction endonuclease [Corynebacterium sp.]
MTYLDLARQAIDELNPELTEQFLAVAEFSQVEPTLAVTRRKTKANPKPSTCDLEHYRFLATKFCNGHNRGELPQPGTIPDPALSIVMRYGYSVAEQNLSELIEGHRIAMVAENMVGDLLERYLNSVLNGAWVWCAGEVVKHVDFIQRPSEPGAPWKALQIKNRDNSENSSSSAIRKGTSILKWYRTKSRTGATMWDCFPVDTEQKILSEEGFQNFVRDLLQDTD